MQLTKKDIVSAVITGVTTGFIAWRIFVFLDVSELMGLSFGLLMILVPVLWLIGVWLGYFLGRWMGFFNQFGRYAAIGFTNASVDFGILNLLMAYTGIATGFGYAGFKVVSFAGAAVHSYFWNKYWAFQSGNETNAAEFLKFIAVNLVSLVINVGVASLIVNFVNPMFGASPEGWANLGAVGGAAIALTSNFLGFKLLVFKKPVSNN